MRLDLGSDLEELIHRKLQSRGAASAEDVVGEALRLLDQQDHELSLLQPDWEEAISAGIDSLADGGGEDGDDVFARLLARVSSPGGQEGQ